MLSALIGVIPAFVGAAMVYWSSDTTFFHLDDLPVLQRIGGNQLSIMRKNKYLINTPDAYTPEPFASLTNLCFFCAGLGFLAFPALMNKASTLPYCPDLRHASYGLNGLAVT